MAGMFIKTFPIYLIDYELEKIFIFFRTVFGVQFPECVGSHPLDGWNHHQLFLQEKEISLGAKNDNSSKLVSSFLKPALPLSKINLTLL